MPPLYVHDSACFHERLGCTAYSLPSSSSNCCTHLVLLNGLVICMLQW